MNMIRQPAVAGQFYPDDPTILRQELVRLVQSELAPQHAKAIIVPHAGYVYSGSLAGELIAATHIPKHVILIGPNHQGLGKDIAVSGADAWQTPLGEVPLAAEMRQELCQEIPALSIDEQAHRFEHSLEVMLPLLMKVRPDLEIVPIALRSLTLNDCLDLGEAIGRYLAQLNREVLLLASSDMNHFLDAEQTEQLDALAIEQMTELNPAGLYRTVRENRISMCGVLPAVVAMQAAKEQGADRCCLQRYAHSGQVNGDNSRVVGYAALSIQ